MSEQPTPETETDGNDGTKGLDASEMAAEGGEALPDREAMSLVNANLAIPVNAAVAANVLSDNSSATAAATQMTPIKQGI
ncbi:MAG: hypothetical protein NVSMB17_11030 [Candidatus Dormibacteria bacterium]